MMITLNSIWMAGAPVHFLAEAPGPRQPKQSRLNDSLQKVRTVPFAGILASAFSGCSVLGIFASLMRGIVRTTSPAICERVPSAEHPLTDDRGTHAEKKGPLHYVNSAKVGEERVRLRDGSDNALVRKVNPAIRL